MKIIRESIVGSYDGIWCAADLSAELSIEIITSLCRIVDGFLGTGGGGLCLH